MLILEFSWYKEIIDILIPFSIREGEIAVDLLPCV